MATTKITKILFRRGSDFDRRPTILDEGEPGWVTDTCRLYLGDGRTPGGFPAVNVRNNINAPLHPNTGELVYEPIGDVTGNAQPAGQEVLAINHTALSATIATTWGDTRYQRISDTLINNSIFTNDLKTSMLSSGVSQHHRCNVTYMSAANMVLGNPLSVDQGGSGDRGDSVSRWNQAYSWGDHSKAGYMFASEAPMYANQVDEMYLTWGDHRAAGYQLISNAVTDLESARSNNKDVSGPINYEVVAGDSTSSDIITIQTNSILRRLNTNNSLKIGTPSTGSSIILGQGQALNHITGETSTWSDEMVHVAGGRAVKLHTYVDGDVNDANHKEAVFQNGTLTVDELAATTKNFNIKHPDPTKTDKRLVHACLEGPENGVYIRGKTDQDYIELPDYWKHLVDESTVTVTLTPIGGYRQYFVESISQSTIKIGRSDPAEQGEYFYHVYGTRTDVDTLAVEIDAK